LALWTASPWIDLISSLFNREHGSIGCEEFCREWLPGFEHPVRAIANAQITPAVVGSKGFRNIAESSGTE
jgi:hypothetical protein